MTQPASHEPAGEPRPRLVLVVDDDDMIRRLVRTVLEADEYEVVEARNGDLALSLANEAHPTVVLLDIMMPGMDGHEVCQRLREWDLRRTTAIIMVTALGAEMEEVHGLEVGADDYVTKPFDTQELLVRMQMVLRRYREHAPQAPPDRAA